MSYIKIDLITDKDSGDIRIDVKAECSEPELEVATVNMMGMLSQTRGVSFLEDVSKEAEGATRYGKDIITNFDVEEDLVFWEMQTKYTKNNYTVTMVHPEISALCPVSGYPDSGKITVQFVPNDKTVELKAFKLWINSFRNVNISHEDLANEVYNTLSDGLEAQKLYVKLEMMPRGNVTTIVEVGEQ